MGDDRRRGYQDLIAWRKGMDLAETVYRLTKNWPREEIYGLTSQIRRAAVSVPANVAEGQGRSSAKEFAQFLSIANGSLSEVETYLVLARRLGYVDAAASETAIQLASEIGRILQGLLRTVRRPSTA